MKKKRMEDPVPKDNKLVHDYFRDIHDSNGKHWHSQSYKLKLDIIYH